MYSGMRIVRWQQFDQNMDGACTIARKLTFAVFYCLCRSVECLGNPFPQTGGPLDIFTPNCIV